MKNILCIGGAGQLGSRVISIFSKYNVVNIDFKPHHAATQNIIFRQGDVIQNRNRFACDSIKSLGYKYDAILVTAGGWTGGNIKDDDYFEKVKHMNQMNLYPSILAAHIATKYLKPQGLVSFTGAAAVYKEPQPDMLAYSLAKAGVHYLASSLAEKAQNFDGRVVTILPEVIDTETNRQGMPNADFSKWAKPQHIGQLLYSWVQGLNVPDNGSFVMLTVKSGCLQTSYI